MFSCCPHNPSKAGATTASRLVRSFAPAGALWAAGDRAEFAAPSGRHAKWARYATPWRNNQRFSFWPRKRAPDGIQLAPPVHLWQAHPSAQAKGEVEGMRQGSRGELWAIVLAGGDGTRLASMIQAMHGRPVPKQFAPLIGDRTLLQRTLDRIAPMIPAQRTVVVVSDQHLELARQQLAGFCGVEIVPQPSNRGTGAGVLLPLAHVLARDPHARVVVFPSDHHVTRTGPFCDAVTRAVKSAEHAGSGVCLLGAAAEAAATDLGWIACGTTVGPAHLSARSVTRFVEKPPERVALELLRQGALWNTLVIAAGGRALWGLASVHVPQVVRALAAYRGRLPNGDSSRVLADIYTHLTASDLSRDILEKAAGLTAVTMSGAGWADCGTPDRLLRALEGTDQLPALQARLRAAQPGLVARV
jgi:mannose-1-phosphate guanylyltransferase